MNQSAKQLLQKIYAFQQNNSEPFDIPVNDVSKFDISYLINNGYITESFSSMGAYHLSLTEKGQFYVENGFSMPSSSNQINNSFNFNGNTFSNSVVGADVNNVNYSFSAGVPFNELKELIASKPAVDQQQLNELLSVLQEIDKSNQPVNKGILVRFSNLLQKYSDLIVPVGKILIRIFAGGGQ